MSQNQTQASNSKSQPVVQPIAEPAVKPIVPMGETIKRVIAKSAEGYPLLGNCIYWSFSEMKMSYAQFLELLEKCEMDKNIAPETRRKSAVQKAVKTFTKDGGKAKFHRKVVDDKLLASFAIVNTELDASNHDVNFATETKIRMDKKTGAIVVEGSPEAQKEIQAHLDDYLAAYTTDQIRAAVLRFVYDFAKGIMVRENGGLYFIPSTHQKEFEKLQKFFELLKPYGSVAIDQIPVIETKEAAQAMWKALVGEAEAEMADMRRDIDDLQKDPSERGKARRLEKMQDLRTKIEMYEVLLTGTAKDLIKKLSDTEKAFINKITDLAKSEADAAKK